MKAFFTLLLLAACGTVTGQATVKDCSSGNSLFKVASLDFSPNPPIAGQNGTLTSVYEVPEQMDAGTTRYSCTLNGLPVYDETSDLCSQTSCPIVVGTHNDKSISQVPATSGKVVCKIDWRSTSGVQLLCIQMTLQLAAAAAAAEKPSLRGSVVTVSVPHFHKHSNFVLNNETMCPLMDYSKALIALE
jgi:hypothetical protein